MYTLFAMPYPPPHYGASLFLASIVAMYLLRKRWTFRETKHFFIACLIIVGLIVLHFVWFRIEYPNRFVIDVAPDIVPTGLVGAFLGFFLGTFKYQRLHRTQDKNEEEND